MFTPQPNDLWIRRISLNLHPPSLEDNTADVDRLVKALRRELGSSKVVAAFTLANGLPKRLRDARYQVDALVYEDQDVWTVFDALPRTDGAASIYGLALDLGSSTMVLRLVDLATGRIAAERSFNNPQIEIGPDILTRIHYAGQNQGLSRLQRLVIDRLNLEIAAAAAENGLSPGQLAGLSVAGNTVMTHLFLGLDPYWICREPYIPVMNTPPITAAGSLGIAIHPSAPVFVFPNVGSYFGGDLIAGIIASGMTERDETAFLVDVGTNAEVVVGNRDWLMACAGAAGPALEGGVASMGMMAAPGVIDKVVIDPESREIRIHTIGELPPIGICGSGLIDLAAQLFLAGMIDLRGKFVREACGGRMIELDGIRHLTVVEAEASGTGEPLYLSQPDIDALIRSKAAMYTILTTIGNTVGIPLHAIERFYVAGTFGSYIDPRSAITVGMIPDLPLETYVSLGNTSLEGATRALLSAAVRRESQAIRDRITYLELNVNQEFMNLFSAAKFIPHTDRSLFPSVAGA